MQLHSLHSISLMERMNNLLLSSCLINPTWGLAIINSPATHPDKWFVPALLILTQNYIIHLLVTEPLYGAEVENSRDGSKLICLEGNVTCLGGLTYQTQSYTAPLSSLRSFMLMYHLTNMKTKHSRGNQQASSLRGQSCFKGHIY